MLQRGNKYLNKNHCVLDLLYRESWRIIAKYAGAARIIWRNVCKGSKAEAVITSKQGMGKKIMGVCHFLRCKQTTKGGPVMLFAQFFAISDIRIPPYSICLSKEKKAFARSETYELRLRLQICKAKLSAIWAIPSTMSNQYDLQLLKRKFLAAFSVH